MLSDVLSSSTCPACGHHVGVSFFEGGHQPLATIAWPRSAQEAQSMTRLPLPFVRCAACGHIYNREFDYRHVPYAQKPNLMYNRALIWGEHLRQIRELILRRLPAEPVVVEVGCGDGHFLRGVAEARPHGRYVGFDPNGSVDTTDDKVEARNVLFDPTTHLDELRPDIVISRHVLEHLINPLGFLQRLAFAAAWFELETLVFIEVPCIDRVFETGRTADFYYEHNSHFTSGSFTRMLGTAATRVEFIDHGYDGEVIYGLARLGGNPTAVALAKEALDFRVRAGRARTVISQQLAELYASGKTVAIWGGTGKGAAFINYFGADAERFPLVVDSDHSKVGTFVPGTGQQIVAANTLREHPVEVVIIPTQWRAADIVAEMARSNIHPKSILLEHRSRLVNYHIDEHPYSRPAGRAE